MAKLVTEDGAPVFVDLTDEEAPLLLSRLTAPMEKEVQFEKGNENTEAGASDVNDSANEDETPKPQLQCPECKRFKTDCKEKMIQHIRRHRGENAFQCYMCEYSTYNKAVFEEHVRVHQGIKPFKCSFCDYCSASKKNAKKHELRHRKDNPLRCEICGFIARHFRSYRLHEETHNSSTVAGGNFHLCKDCNVKFLTETGLQNHVRDCKYCPMKFCKKADLDKHLNDSHLDEKKKKGETVHFKCARCPWESTLKSRILLHLIHHPNQDVDESKIDISVLRKYGIMT